MFMYPKLFIQPKEFEIHKQTVFSHYPSWHGLWSVSLNHGMCGERMEPNFDGQQPVGGTLSHGTQQGEEKRF